MSRISEYMDEMFKKYGIGNLLKKWTFYIGNATR